MNEQLFLRQNYIEDLERSGAEAFIATLKPARVIVNPRDYLGVLDWATDERVLVHEKRDDEGRVLSCNIPRLRVVLVPAVAQKVGLQTEKIT